MGKTLKYGSHDFPSAAGFTGSAGDGPIPVRAHARVRLARGGQFKHPPDSMPENLPVERHGLKEGGKWIAGAIKHPGALHRQLGVPQGEKIPAKKLAKAANSDNPKLAKRAQLAETLKGMHKAEGGRVGALSRYARGGKVEPHDGAHQVRLPATAEIERAGNPGQKLMPGYKGGGKPRNFDQGGVVADQGTTAALDQRLRALATQTGMALAPAAARQAAAGQPPAAPTPHGTGAYQGSPQATVGGALVQPEREGDVYSRGTAPLNAAALGAALQNATGVMNPVESALKTAAAAALGMDPGALGGFTNIPGYQGPAPQTEADIYAGRQTASRAQAAERQNRATAPLGGGYTKGPFGLVSGPGMGTAGGGNANPGGGGYGPGGNAYGASGNFEHDRSTDPMGGMRRGGRLPYRKGGHAR